MFTHWTSPEAVFQIMKRLSAGRPCDFSGIHDYRAIDQASGIQWPAPAPEREFEKERRLFSDGRFYTDDARARFIFDPPRAMPEPPCEKFPYLLLTGRGTSAQWHTQTRTAKSDVLRRLYPEPEVEVGPRLIIETNDGTLINRSMSTVKRVNIENGQVVVTGKDGKISRVLLINVVRMTIAP